ncbi:CobW family GTP-binding protein [Vagococcus vulneris]|uniref:CobW C-terminal domain-containing protein n=1 Tax=Vagococcus vulneris TaxID=1977869 RepID=A0A429ZSM0_9ENTE|nr:GTP-binding protein [Vagococcus vulneris]RST96730.1 hypothetical protein CBF37_10740 [Vagococcus vulneris]
MGIPINIVSGFLGAGKTTFINEMIKETTIASDDIAIIVNEFGEVGIDHELMIHAEERLYQLNSGCICCSLREDLASTLEMILKITKEQGRPLKQIIIETTGIADPQPIIQTLKVTPKLSGYFYLDTVFCVVDAVNYQSTLSNYSEAEKQIAMADRFIITKLNEQYAADKQEIQQKLSSINPVADYYEFSFSTIFKADCLFFNQHLFRSFEPQIVETDNYKEQHEHHHHGSVSSMSLSTLIPLEESLMRMWIDWLLMTYDGQLYRYKGLIRVKNYELVIALQGVSTHYTLETTNKSPLDFTSQLVLIGKDLDREKIEQSFKDLVMRSYQEI